MLSDSSELNGFFILKLSHIRYGFQSMLNISHVYIYIYLNTLNLTGNLSYEEGDFHPPFHCNRKLY